MLVLISNFIWKCLKECLILRVFRSGIHGHHLVFLPFSAGLVAVSRVLRARSTHPWAAPAFFTRGVLLWEVGGGKYDNDDEYFDHFFVVCLFCVWLCCSCPFKIYFFLLQVPVLIVVLMFFAAFCIMSVNSNRSKTAAQVDESTWKCLEAVEIFWRPL